MKNRELFENEIVALIRNTQLSQTLSEVCLAITALHADVLCADEVFSLCLDLERPCRISFMMDATGLITVY